MTNGRHKFVFIGLRFQQSLSATFELKVSFLQTDQLLLVQYEIKHGYPKHIGRYAHQRDRRPIEMLFYESKIAGQIPQKRQGKQAANGAHRHSHPNKGFFETHQYQARQGQNAKPQNLWRCQATGVHADDVNEREARRQQSVGYRCHGPFAPDIHNADQGHCGHGQQT